MHQACNEGEFELRCSDHFAVVTMYGRVLTVYSRSELAGVCHPERN